MKTKQVRLIKYIGKDFERRSDAIEDGLHLIGFPNQMTTETMCGIVDNMATNEAIIGEPTCKNCISVAKEFFTRYTKAQVDRW
jgi:hypothetical protein